MTKCDCHVCRLAHRIENEKQYMSEETLRIVKDLWNEWEDTSNQLCYNAPKVEAFDMLFPDCKDIFEFKDHLTALLKERS